MSELSPSIRRDRYTQVRHGSRRPSPADGGQERPGGRTRSRSRSGSAIRCPPHCMASGRRRLARRPRSGGSAGWRAGPFFWAAARRRVVDTRGSGVAGPGLRARFPRGPARVESALPARGLLARTDEDIAHVIEVAERLVAKEQRLDLALENAGRAAEGAHGRPARSRVSAEAVASKTSPISPIPNTCEVQLDTSSSRTRPGVQVTKVCDSPRPRRLPGAPHSFGRIRLSDALGLAPSPGRTPSGPPCRRGCW